MTGVEPCRICGAPVRIRHERGEMSAADASPPIVERRVCTDPQCDSNTGQMSIADVV